MWVGFFLRGGLVFCLGFVCLKDILGSVQEKNASCLTEQSTGLSSLLSRGKNMCMCAMSLLPLLPVFPQSVVQAARREE